MQEQVPGWCVLFSVKRLTERENPGHGKVEVEVHGQGRTNCNSEELEIFRRVFGPIKLRSNNMCSPDGGKARGIMLCNSVTHSEEDFATNR